MYRYDGVAWLSAQWSKGGCQEFSRLASCMVTVRPYGGNPALPSPAQIARASSESHCGGRVRVAGALGRWRQNGMKSHEGQNTQAQFVLPLSRWEVRS